MFLDSNDNLGLAYLQLSWTATVTSIWPATFLAGGSDYGLACSKDAHAPLSHNKSTAIT
jgi:hypothetical protein